MCYNNQYLVEQRFVYVEVRISGGLSNSKGGGGSSTVNTLVYFLTYI